MGVITNIRLGFRLRNFYLISEAVKKINNWPDYFLDLFSLSLRKFTVFNMKDSLKYLVRARTCDRGIITTVALADQYEVDKLSFSDNAVVIDIGAHIGIFTVYISKKAGTIFSYEPLPENFGLLQENVFLNSIENKTRLFNCAVAGTKKTMKLYHSKENTGAHSFSGSGNRYTEVPCISLQEVFDTNKIQRCEFLKIDAEGAEYEMLYSLPKNYFTRVQRIYLEYHALAPKKSGECSAELKKFLEENGYTVTIKQPMLFARRQ